MDYYNDTIKGYFEKIEDLLKKEDNPIGESKIQYSGNYKKRENHKPDTGIVNETIERADFIKNFENLPFNEIHAVNSVTINHYFYEYSVIGEDDYNNEMISFMMNDTIPSDIKEPKFLYLSRKLHQKFDKISKFYISNLGLIRDKFLLPYDSSEETALVNIIKFYNSEIKKSDTQLQLFWAVTFTKEISDLFIRILIEYFTIRLNIIKPDYEKYYITEQNTNNSVKKIDGEFVYQLPKDFKLNMIDGRVSKLNLQSTGLFYYFLKKHGMTVDYSKQSYSEVVQLITGYSKNTIFQKVFTKISLVERETSSLIDVQRVLENILDDVEEQIKKSKNY